MGDSMNSFRSQQQVKEELLSVLRDDPGNNDRIVALSNELAKLDENYVRFSVDAGIQPIRKRTSRKKGNCRF